MSVDKIIINKKRRRGFVHKEKYKMLMKYSYKDRKKMQTIGHWPILFFIFAWQGIDTSISSNQ